MIVDIILVIVIAALLGVLMWRWNEENPFW